jgi:hypothetical protein
MADVRIYRADRANPRSMGFTALGASRARHSADVSFSADGGETPPLQS